MADPPRRLRPLLVSRVADQGSLALASFAMALVLDPSEYTRVALVLIFGSLSVQLSDIGLGFAMMSRGADRLRAATAQRLQRTNAALAAVATVGGLGAWAAGADGGAAVLVAYAGLVWAATGEAFVRRSAALTEDQIARVARAEVAGSATLVVGLAIAAMTASPAVLAIALVVRYSVEAALLPSWRAAVAEDGRALGAPLEWIGQAVTFAAANADYAVVALWFGGDALAVYTLAFRTASGAFALLANPLTQRALVDLGQIGPDQPEELRSHNLVVLRRQSLAGAVAVAAAVAIAPMVSYALDAQWDQTLPLTIVLAAALPARLLVGPAVALGLALGRRALVIGVESARGLFVVGAGAAAAGVGATLLQVTMALTAATIIGAVAASGTMARRVGPVALAALLGTVGIGVAVAATGWLVLNP